MKRRKEYFEFSPSRGRSIHSLLIKILNKALPVESSIAKLENSNYTSNYEVNFGDITFEAVEKDGSCAYSNFFTKIKISAYLPYKRKVIRTSINKCNNSYEFCLTDIKRKYYKIKEIFDEDKEKLEKEEEKNRLLKEKIDKIKELSGLKTSKYLTSYSSLNGEQLCISIRPIPVKLVCLIVPKIEKMIQDFYDSLNNAE